MTEPTELKSVDEMPVLPDMTQDMRLSLGVNSDGEILVFHEGAFLEDVNWAEYSADNSTLFFVTKVGRIQAVGLKVLEHIHEKIMAANPRVFAVCLEDGQEKQVVEMPLVINRYT